jgi:hypothetical protein
LARTEILFGRDWDFVWQGLGFCLARSEILFGRDWDFVWHGLRFCLSRTEILFGTGDYGFYLDERLDTADNSIVQ